MTDQDETVVSLIGDFVRPLATAAVEMVGAELVGDTAAADARRAECLDLVRTFGPDWRAAAAGRREELVFALAGQGWGGTTRADRIDLAGAVFDLAATEYAGDPRDLLAAAGEFGHAAWAVLQPDLLARLNAMG